jgi:hypothetical protein
MWWGIFFLHSGIWGEFWNLNKALLWGTLCKDAVLLTSEDVAYGYFFSLSYTVGGLIAPMVAVPNGPNRCRKVTKCYHIFYSHVSILWEDAVRTVSGTDGPYTFFFPALNQTYCWRPTFSYFVAAWHCTCPTPIFGAHILPCFAGFRSRDPAWPFNFAWCAHGARCV